MNFNPLEFGFVYQKKYDAYVVNTDSFVYNIKNNSNILAWWYIEITSHSFPQKTHTVILGLELEFYKDENYFYKILSVQTILEELYQFIMQYKRKSIIDNLLLDLK